MTPVEIRNEELRDVYSGMQAILRDGESADHAIGRMAVCIKALAFHVDRLLNRVKELEQP